jgi:hypothetical protein
MSLRAQLTPEEEQKILSYLNLYYGKEGMEQNK